jgi:hypothetical protein
MADTDTMLLILTLTAYLVVLAAGWWAYDLVTDSVTFTEPVRVRESEIVK